MMLGRVMPVRLPYSADESMLVTRRQNKLARDIDIINQKIRNNVLSRSEGATRIRFKQSEIDELQRYKSSKRVPTGRLSPPPQRQKVIPRSGKPANKYNPYAEDKVSRATGPNVFDGGDLTFERASPDSRQKAYEKSTAWTEDDRAGYTSRGNDRADGRKPPQAEPDGTNSKGLLAADYYSRFLTNYQNIKGSNPSARDRKGMEMKAESYWRNNRPLPAQANKSTRQQGQSVVDKAKSWWSSAKANADSRKTERREAAIQKVMTDHGFTAEEAEEIVNSNPHLITGEQNGEQIERRAQDHPAKTVKDNPHGRNYGGHLTMKERMQSMGKAKKVNGTYYGPKSMMSADNWEDWNAENGIAGFAGMPNYLIQSRSRALRDTALMRKRAGARINFDNPNMTNNTQMRSWETYAKPEDVAMIKTMLPKMTALEKFPELTPAGNAMMIEVVKSADDMKKMEIAANKLATDLMNKSGYFVKQYSVKVDPLQRKVKISEMSSLAGGLSKTRNSMQRLLK